MRRGPVGTHGCVDRVLQFLQIGVGAIIENHQVDAQAFGTPVFVGAQQRLQPGDLLQIAEPQQHDRQVAGNAHRPEIGLYRQPALQRFRGWPEAGVAVQDRRRQSLEIGGFLQVDVEMAQLHLCLGPGERARAFEGAGVVVLVDQRQQRFATLGDHRPEVDVGDVSRRNAQDVAQREDRVQHGAGGVRQRLAVQRHRVAELAAPAQEAYPVRFICGFADALPLDQREMRRPDRRLLRLASTPGGGQRGVVGDEIRLDEQLGECRVGVVGGGLGQHDFGVGGHLDRYRMTAAVGHRDAADFAVVLAGYQHLERGGEVAVAAGETGVILGEHRFPEVGRSGNRMRAGGPASTAVEIAKQDEAAPVVAGGVFAPARDRLLLPTAVAGAGRGQHHAVAAVGKEVGHRRRGGLALEPAYGRRGRDDARRRCMIGIVGRRQRRDFSRQAFLQQQFAGLDHRFAVEVATQSSLHQGVGDGGDGHPLMMRHDVAHDDEGAIDGQSRKGEIDRLEEPEVALGLHRSQAGEVIQRGAGRDHGRQRRGIGCDDEVVAQPALEPQLRHAEVGILVGEVDVPGVIGGFRNAPGDIVALGILALAGDDQTVGLLEQAPQRGTHDQRGHQIFEHRARPGDQRDAILQRRYRPPQAEPVAGGQVALGDRQQARQAGLGSEQVIAAVVDPVLSRGVADRHQLAFRHQQEMEIHPQCQPARLVRQVQKPLLQRRLPGVGVGRGVMRNDGSRERGGVFGIVAMLVETVLQSAKPTVR